MAPPALVASWYYGGVLTVGARVAILLHLSKYVLEGVCLDVISHHLLDLSPAADDDLDRVSELLLDQRLHVGAVGRIGAGVLSDRVGSRLRPLRWVAVAGIPLLLLTGLSGELHVAPLVAVAYVLASCVSVADNGLAFTAVAEIAGAHWSGRELGTQNTGQFLTAALVAPLVGLLIGVVGYPLAFALTAIAPAVAVPLVPAD